MRSLAPIYFNCQVISYQNLSCYLQDFEQSDTVLLKKQGFSTDSDVSCYKSGLENLLQARS